MPMLTTVSMRRPVAPTQSPERRLSVNRPIASSTACTSATTSWPSTTSFASRGSRSAVCNTARSSLVFTCCPVNIASMRSPRSAALARAQSSSRVCRSIRCLDRSTCRSPAVSVSAATRPGSSANSSRRCRRDS